MVLSDDRVAGIEPFNELPRCYSICSRCGSHNTIIVARPSANKSDAVRIYSRCYSCATVRVLAWTTHYGQQPRDEVFAWTAAHSAPESK